MSGKFELEQYEKAVEEIRSLTRIYEEAVFKKMSQVRLMIEKIAKFLDNISNVYTQAKIDYYEENLDSKNNIKSGTVSRFQGNGKTVLVFISSEKEVGSNLIINIYRKFAADLQKTGFDGVIIGATGKSLLVADKLKVGPNLAFFDLTDDNPAPNQIKQIVEVLTKYDKIVVYYGEFVSILNQTPKTATIEKLALASEKAYLPLKKFLYEPKLAEIVRFFHHNSVTAELEEKIYQAQLAQFGAKIKIIEIGQVAQKISEVIENIDKARARLGRKLFNKKQMEVFYGYNVWAKHF